MLKLQISIEEALKAEVFDSKSLTDTENITIRLIVKYAHDSLIVTSRILQSFIVQGKENSSSFLMADPTEDSGEAAYSNLQHFFANHFNQLLTILVNWNDEEADFTALIERDS